VKGSNSKQNKSVNLRLVLSQIVTQGPVSRADIARATYLTKQTITNLVDELLQQQLVVETGVKKEGVGKPSTQLILNDDAAYSLAIRVKFNKVELALCYLTGALVTQCSAAFQAGQLLHVIEQQLQQLLAAHQLTALQLLGAGLTIEVTPDQSITERQQQMLLLQQQLVALLKMPVATEQTAAACAAYHLLHGEARALQSFCYIHLGQQVDAAVVYERRILLGHNGLTGALGEIFVTPEQDKYSGEFGRLNDFVSVSSLQQFAQKKLQTQLNTEGNQWSEAELLADKLELWFEQSAEPMRIAIHTLESIFNCQTIILGGEVSAWFLDKLISRLRPLIPSVAQHGSRTVPRLIKTPEVEKVALQGLATLPLHAAIRLDAQHALMLPPVSLLSTLQQLVFSEITPAGAE
jgi:predicted NBD/HSP70 family sugar kinase